MGGAEDDALQAPTTSTRPSTRRRRSVSTAREERRHRESSSIRRCKYCDRQHGCSKESCPAYGQTRKRSKANHFASVCKSAGKRQQVCEVTEELLTLGNVDSVRAYCNLNVNGRSVRLMLDCGSTVNILPLSDASSIDPHLTTLRPAEARLTMFDGTELKTLGMLAASVQHPLSGKRRLSV